MRAPTCRSMSWVRPVERRDGAAARSPSVAALLELGRSPSPSRAIVIRSCSLILLSPSVVRIVTEQRYKVSTSGSR
jgi:hypothetical protein